MASAFGYSPIPIKWLQRAHGKCWRLNTSYVRYLPKRPPQDNCASAETAPATRQDREILTSTAARAASLGEPWLSFFEPEEMDGLLKQAGFS
jgi:hypothetical protein